jgi:hypothetical protein
MTSEGSVFGSSLRHTTEPYIIGPKDNWIPVDPLRLVAEIGNANEASIRLFEKLGFEKTKVVEVFNEVEMRFRKPELIATWEQGGFVNWE